MSIQQLEALWPNRPTLKVDELLLKKRRMLIRSLKRNKRRTLAMLRRQYYITNALAETNRAGRRNEDIVLASLIIIAVVSFSATSILANVVYLFVMAGSVLSTISGLNLALLLIVACSVVGILFGWAAAWVQNLLTISLMEGATRKQKRSLRLTISKGLRFASSTATAWCMVLMGAFGPAFVALIGILAIIYFAHASWSTSLPYLFGMTAICFGWIIWVFANYTLLPYVRLFEKTLSWRAAIMRSRELVQYKGRLFILSGYVAFGGSLALAYGISIIVQRLTTISSTLFFLLLSTTAVSAANAVLTMFYRKRKLARK